MSAHAADVTHSSITVPYSTAYYIDTTGLLGIDNVTDKSFIPYTGTVSKGYTKNVTWIRITVPATERKDLVLTVRPIYLDDIRLYSPIVEPERASSAVAPATAWLEKRTGDHTNFADRERQETNYSFNLPTQQNKDNIYYLRIDTTSTHMIYIEVDTEQEALEKEYIRSIGMGLYIGLVACLGFFAVGRWIVYRNPLWLLSAAFHFMAIISAFFLLGAGARLISPHNAHFAEYAYFYSAVHLMPIYSALMLLLFKPYPGHWLAKLHWHIPIYSYFIIFGLELMGEIRWAMIAISISMSFCGVWGSVAPWFLKIDDPLLRRSIRFGGIFFIGLSLSITFPFLGLMKSSMFSLYHILTINLGLALFTLALLSRQQYLENLEIQIEAYASKEARLALEREQTLRKNNSTFLDMLVHEIRTALTVVKLVIRRVHTTTQQLAAVNTTGLSAASITSSSVANADLAVAEIEGILQRVLDADRLEYGATSLNPKYQDIVVVIKNRYEQFAEREKNRMQLLSPISLKGNIDEALLVRMLDNLIKNALTYSPANTPVHIEVSSQLDRGVKLLVTVRNEIANKTDIDEDKLFSKYYRGDAAKHTSGTGLGLYWVRGMARQQGGDVRFERKAASVVVTLQIPV